MLPQYEITAFLARGGMGAVYKGVQKSLKRGVAIKVLPPDADDGELNFAARFQHEAQAMARLSHPNIVAVFDAGQTAEGVLYFVMEFIEGTDVAQVIAAEGRLEPSRALSIISTVCEALAFAHEEGIIHRDIKPSNIMLDRKGRVKVADFGLAKTASAETTALTGSRVTMGTPDFIAPEALIPGITVDARADLYAVGVMLYQMLTGRIPRGRFDPLTRVVPGLDKRLDGIVDHAMQNDRNARYSSAIELKSAIEPVLTRTLARRTAAAPAAQPARRKPALLLAAAILLPLLGIGAFLLLKPQDPSSKLQPPSSKPQPSPTTANHEPQTPAPTSLPDGPPGFVKELTGHTGRVRTVQALPDGRRVLSATGPPASSDHNEVILWDLASGQPLWKKQLLDAPGAIGEVAVLPSVSRAVTILRGAEQALTQLDLETGAVLRRVTMPSLNGDYTYFLTVHPDGRRFIAGFLPSRTDSSHPMVLQLWDADGREPLGVWKVDKVASYFSSAWLDDHRILVGFPGQAADGFKPGQVLVDTTQPGTFREFTPQGRGFYFAMVPGRPDLMVAHAENTVLALFDWDKETLLRQWSVSNSQRRLVFLDDHRVPGSRWRSGCSRWTLPNPSPSPTAASPLDAAWRDLFRHLPAGRFPACAAAAGLGGTTRHLAAHAWPRL